MSDFDRRAPVWGFSEGGWFEIPRDVWERNSQEQREALARMDAKLKAAERFELRYARSKEVRWCLGFVLDALLAPAMLPADGWSVRLVAERCELDCDDDAEPVHPARLVAGNAVDVLCERFISVTRGRWNRARWNDPDDTLWGLGL